MKNRNKTFIKRTVSVLLASLMFFLMAGISGYTSGTEVVHAANRDQVKKTVMIEGVEVTSEIAKSDQKLETLLKLGGFPEQAQRDAFKKYYKEVLGVMKDEGFDQKSVQKRADELKAMSKVKEGKVSKVDDFMTGKTITAPGFFTGGYKEDNFATCEAMKDASNEKQADIMEEQVASESEIAQIGESDNAKAKGNKSLIEMVGGINEGFIDPEDAEAKSAKEISGNGLFGVNCSDMGFFKNLTNLYNPVNITDSKFIMNMVFAFQVIAMGIAVLLIAVFGAYYATGNETAVDPFKFAIRAFVVFLVVYYLPYFAQDILNINNMLVYWIGMTDIDITNASTVTGAGMLTFTASLSTILLAFAQASAFAAVPGVLLIGAVILLILIIFIAKAIITLVFWWYARFLMLMFLIVLGPVFIIMMLLPKTANYGTKWLQFFIGEVFTQTFMVIGFFFVESLFSNLPGLHLGLVGNTIILYCSILLLSKIPNISKSLVGSDMGGVGWSDARNVGNAVGEVVQKAGMAAISATGNKYLSNQQQNLRKERDGLEAEDREKPNDDGVQDRIAANRAKVEDLNNRLQRGEDNMKNLAKYEKGRLDVGASEVMADMNKTSRNEDAISDAQYNREKDYKDSSLAELKKKEDEKLAKASAKFASSIGKAEDRVIGAKKELDEATTDEGKAAAQEKLDAALISQNTIADEYKAAIAENKKDTDLESLKANQAWLRREADEKFMKNMDKALGTADFKNPMEKTLQVAKELDESTAKMSEKKNSIDAADKAFLAANSPSNSLEETMSGQSKDGTYHMPDLNRGEVKPLADKLGAATKELAHAKQEAATKVMNQSESRNHPMDMATANKVVDAQATQASLLSLPSVKGELSNLNEEQRKQYDEAGKTLEGQPEAVLAMAKQVSGSVISANNNLQGAVQSFHNNSGLEKDVATRTIDAVQTGAAVSHAITSPTMQGIISQGFQNGGNIDAASVVQTIESAGLVSGEAASEYAQQIQTSVAQAHQGVSQTVSSMQSNPNSMSSVEFVQNLSSQYQSAGISGDAAEVQARTMAQTLSTNAYDKEVGAKALTYMVDEGYSRNDAFQYAQNEVGPAPDFMTGDLSAVSMVNTPVTSVSANSFNDKIQKEIGQSFDSGIANRPTFSDTPVTAEAISKYGMDGAQQKFEALTTAVQKAHAFTSFDKIPDFAKNQVHELVKQGPISDSQKSGLRDNIIKELDGHGIDRRDSRAIADTYIDYSFENELTKPVSLSLPEDYKNIIKTQVVEMKQENPNGKINMRRELENYAGNNQALFQESMRYSQELIDALENE